MVVGAAKFLSSRLGLVGTFSTFAFYNCSAARGGGDCTRLLSPNLLLNLSHPNSVSLMFRKGNTLGFGSFGLGRVYIIKLNLHKCKVA